MHVLSLLLLSLMIQDNAKTELWAEFLAANKVAEESVPLFDTESGAVKIIEYGRNSRKVLKRSGEMELLMRKLGRNLSEQHASGKVKSSGILYMMLRKDDEQMIPLYIGKAEIYGKGDGNLSANISDLVSGNGKVWPLGLQLCLPSW